MKIPCWGCWGKGTWKEDIIDYGQGPTITCGYCGGDGMIEVGGDRHLEIKRRTMSLQTRGSK